MHLIYVFECECHTVTISNPSVRLNSGWCMKTIGENRISALLLTITAII